MPTYPVLMHTAVDAVDARRLAEFYRELLGVSYRPGEEPPTDGSPDDADWLVLVDEQGRRVMAIQEVPELQRPSWPSHSVAKQMHMDFRVPTLEALHRQRERAQSLGARLLFDRTSEEDEPLFVLADPEGHPFCMLVGRG